MTLKLLILTSLVLQLFPTHSYAWGEFHERNMPMEENELKELKANYYSALDYFDAEIVTRMPEYERVLLKDSTAILEKPIQDISPFEGLRLAYTAMYMANNRNAVYDGYISVDSFNIDQRFTPDLGQAQILLARQYRIVEMIKVANKLNPENPRIVLWLSGCELILHVMENKSITPSQYEKLLDQSKMGMFGFFNSVMTLDGIHKFNPEFEIDQNVENSLRDRAVEILRLLPKNQVDTKETMNRGRQVPYSVIGSLNILGNVIAQASEKESEPKLRNYYLNKARKAWTFAQLPFVTGLSRYAWPRLEDAKEIRQSFGILKKKKSGYNWDSLAAKRIFSCAACHTSH